MALARSRAARPACALSLRAVMRCWRRSAASAGGAGIGVKHDGRALLIPCNAVSASTRVLFSGKQAAARIEGISKRSVA